MATTEVAHTDVSRHGRHQVGDRVFAGSATSAGVLILAVLAGVAIFLIAKGLPAITADQSKINGGHGIVAYVWPLLFGTVLAAVIAMLVAVPLALGVALCIAYYVPRRLGSAVAYLIDLLAAVPSVVYGLWGITFFAPRLVPLYAWLDHHLGFVPFFAGPFSPTGRTILTAGLVLAVMILPIITAVTREIFLQTPRLNEEAALALGATRWEMIRMAALPYGRSGIVSAAMLGLGRALGETMAVAMVLSASGVVTFNLISSTNPSTIAANIALNFKEATGLHVNTLIASGLALFAVTFVVNFAARAIIARHKEFDGARA
jgi:phosphate transport system permease protein